MVNKKLASIACFSALTVWAGLAISDTSDVVISCSKCTLDEAAWRAGQAVRPNREDFVYVANFETEILWRFNVKSTVVDGVSSQDASPVEVDHVVRKSFEDWLRVKQIHDSTQVEIPVKIGVASALDLIRSGRNQWLVAAYLLEIKGELLNFPNELISDSPSFMAFAASEYYTRSKNIEIETMFPDRSTARYKMVFPKKLEETTVDIEYVVESPMDSDGNRMPYSRESLGYSSGELIIAGAKESNFQKWKELVNMFGFEVTGNWDEYAPASCDYKCNSHICKVECLDSDS